MLYSLMRALMFQLDAEKAHHFGLKGLSALEMSGLSSLLYPKTKATPVSVMGLTFPNPVGLAAGLDKMVTISKRSPLLVSALSKSVP
jgi:dihydroorotate dehydrogenase